MKLSVLSTLAVAGVVSAEMSLQSMSMQGANMMQSMMQYKQSLRDERRAAGDFDINRYQRAESAPCINGKAGEYDCNNVDLLDHLRHQDMGSRSRDGNDLWGSYHSNKSQTSISQEIMLTMEFQVGHLPTVVSLPLLARPTVPLLSKSSLPASSDTLVASPRRQKIRFGET